MTTMSKKSESDYQLRSGEAGEAAPGFMPQIDYAPRFPKHYRPKIGLIGCGGISRSHLKAYLAAGLDVVALCDIDEAAARTRQEEYYPNAKIVTNSDELLAREDIEVVDIALHPKPRAAVIEAALKAGKHVLSQKPFALDLDEAERLVALAESKNLKLAVNQNGRWAPYVRCLHKIIEQGLIGDIHTANINLHWDHTWIRGKAFEKIHHIILYDFAVHWVDMTLGFFGHNAPKKVFGSVVHLPNQTIVPPLAAGALLEFEHGLANLSFDAFCVQGPAETLIITGSKGVATATGGVTSPSEIHLVTDQGEARIALQGSWFTEGFQGTMAELLCSIEEDREPSNSGRNNLVTLATVFAAIGSADSGQPLVPGANRQLDHRCVPDL